MCDVVDADSPVRAASSPSKVDRSAAFMVRFLVKQVVAPGTTTSDLNWPTPLGVFEPVSFLVDAEGAGLARDAELAAALRQESDLTPAGFIRQLRLQRPIYSHTAAYEHFGRTDLLLPWEAVAAENAL